LLEQYIFLLIFSPIIILVVFDGGKANAIDIAGRKIKHLCPNSNDAQMAAYFLATQQLRLSKIRLIGLKHDYPDDLKVREALDVVNEYFKNRKWWNI